jgi:hypothetical protein
MILLLILIDLYESMILVDRFLFLKESYDDVLLYPLFNQSISPRNMVLVCKK